MDEAKTDFVKESWQEWACKKQMIKKKSLPH